MNSIRRGVGAELRFDPGGRDIHGEEKSVAGQRPWDSCRIHRDRARSRSLDEESEKPMNSGPGPTHLEMRGICSISYILVFLMIVCIIMAISRLLHNALPDWHSGVVAGVMLLIVIDRLLLHQRLKSLSAFSPEWAMIFVTQWIVFIVFIRLLLSYANGLDAFVTDMLHFVRGDFENFFSPEFILTLLLAVLAWYLPAQFLELLDEIGLSQILALGEEPSIVQSDAMFAHRRLVNLIFGMGIVIVIVTALARVDLRGFLATRRFSCISKSFRPGSRCSPLLHFWIGPARSSRLMSLQTGWNGGAFTFLRITLQGNGVYSLIFLIVIVLGVSLSQPVTARHFLDPGSIVQLYSGRAFHLAIADGLYLSCSAFLFF
jgi:hypothetical protein